MAHKSFQKHREGQGKHCEGLRVSIRVDLVIGQKLEEISPLRQITNL